jgi:hypothetical protein
VAFENQGAGTIGYLQALNDLSAAQYKAVVGDPTSGQVVTSSTAGGRVLGILQNAPKAGQNCSIWCHTSTTKWLAGGTIAAFDPVTDNGDGTCKKATGGDVIAGYAMEAAASGFLVSVHLGG